MGRKRMGRKRQKERTDMARTVDITDKLTFDGNPSLVIRGKKLEVNADAPTMLRIMNLMTADGVEIEQIGEAYGLVFPEKSQKVIDSLKLSINDWTTVVMEAMNLIMGDGDSQGEQ